MSDFNPNEMFEGLLKKLDSALQELGIHSETMTIAGQPEDVEPGSDESVEFMMDPEAMVNQIKQGKGYFIIAVKGRTKDLCWTERILDPAAHEASQIEEVIMPTTRDMLKADIERQLEEGVAPEDIEIADIFKMGDDDGLS